MAEFRSPKLTVDGVMFDGDSVLLIRRVNPPFEGVWALPGGFVEYGEKVEDAVVREVSEETGLTVVPKRLVGVYSDPLRDPRHHTVGVVFECAVVGGRLKAGDDAKEVGFFKKAELPQLAFDHSKIVADAFGSRGSR